MRWSLPDTLLETVIRKPISDKVAPIEHGETVSKLRVYLGFCNYCSY